MGEYPELARDPANERQIGGDHYKGSAYYQHWDWVMEGGLNYLQGCATKYISRHRKKNGPEDLQKALHYIDKAVEFEDGRRDIVNKNDVSYDNRIFHADAFWRFALENELTLEEAFACQAVALGQWEAATAAVNKLLNADS